MRDFKDIQIAVAGTGYVGLSIATLLARLRGDSRSNQLRPGQELLRHSPHRRRYRPRAQRKSRGGDGD